MTDSTPKRPQFSFRLSEEQASAFRDRLKAEFIRPQDVLETLTAAWSAGLLDVRELRAQLDSPTA